MMAAEVIKSAVEQSPVIVDKIVERLPIAASAAPVIFGLTDSQIGIFGGLLVAILTLIGSMYYKHVQTEIMRQAMLNHQRRDDISDALQRANEFARND